jgi:hypothetical protein
VTSRTADPSSVLAAKTLSASALLSGSQTPGVLKMQEDGFISSEHQSGRFKGLLNDPQLALLHLEIHQLPGFRLFASQLTFAFALKLLPVAWVRRFWT